jgi:DNA-3-methyladenine glycosylase
MVLNESFYRQENVVDLARQLLGKILVTQIDGKYCSGIICETEAYEGVTDKASHAYGGRRTRRTETMYMQGGHAYVYLCYGMHHLFNVVTHKEGVPHAILIRGIIPLDGKETMLMRRKKIKVDKTLCSGPGTLSQAMGISVLHDRIALTGQTIYIEDRDIKIPDEAVMVGPRIGVDYAADHALFPYRFLIRSDYGVLFE